MKKIIISLVALPAFVTCLNAQSRFEKAAEDAAIVVCDCVNKTYKSFDEIMSDEDGVKSKQLEECMEANNELMNKKFEGLELEPGFSDEMMFKLMLEKLASKEKCELANMMMQLGRQVEDEESDENEDE
jgi:hypothetical protein